MKLFLFTANYPYGFKEPFLDLELEYISKVFEKVYIIPCSFPVGNTSKRRMPANVKSFVPFLSKNIPLRIFRSVFNKAPALGLVLEFFKNSVFLSYSRLNRWGNDWICSRTFLSSRHYNLFSKIINQNDVLYFYWGVGIATIIPFLPLSNRIVLRLHGGDAFSRLGRGFNYLPFRKEIYGRTDVILTVSEKLKSHLAKNYKIDNIERKITIARLGTKTFGLNPLEANDTIVIVSCSNLIPLKRIERILQSLRLIRNQLVEWHHFGDGPLSGSIKSLSEELPSNIKSLFHGQVGNDEILRFYTFHHIDLFINVSSTEGIPVSIMEAMSAGIIVAATDVGATSELVDDECGYVLDANFTNEDLSSIILNVRHVDYETKRQLSRIKWEKYYNSESNFNFWAKLDSFQ